MSNLVSWSDASFEGDPENQVGNSAIRESINNILSTSPGERLFNPQFGCKLDSILFEPCDEVTADLILMELNRAITYWDPRIKIDLAKTRIIPIPDELRFDVNLVIYVIGLPSTNNFSFSLNSLDDSSDRIQG